MFIEPLLNHNIYRGWVEVICGPMFSGKTEELIRRLKRAKIAAKKVAIFKPMLDVRYSADDVVSHDSTSIPSMRLNRAMEILDHFEDAEVIAVDEVQFFDDKIVDVIQYLAYKGKRVIAAGLDMDSDAKPFGPMPRLLATAEFVTKLHAICVDCGTLATYTYRISDEKGQVLIGAFDKYKPLCRHCYYLKTNMQNEISE
jgi:thymidine kinase